jgi:hypothetical protein
MRAVIFMIVFELFFAKAHFSPIYLGLTFLKGPG